MKKKKTHVNQKNAKRDKRVASSIVFRNFLPFFAIFILFWCGCSAKTEFRCDATGTALPWTHTKFLGDAKEFGFAIVADRTGGARLGVFESAVEKLNLLRPEFVLSIGDLIEGGTTDEPQIAAQWDEFDGIVGKLKMPFFYLPGNHDVGNDAMLKVWNQRRGRPYYHFLYEGVLFLCLDSEGGIQEHRQGKLGEDQIAYFDKVMKDNSAVRWTVVLVHEPMWCYPNNNWGDFEKRLAGRRYTVFAGHQHQYASETREGNCYIRLGMTGGVADIGGLNAGRDELIRFGVFDHVVWVTMTAEGPQIAVLTLDGIYDQNVTLAAMADFAKKLRKQFKKSQ